MAERIIGFRTDPMFGDRRQHTRFRINRVARFHSDDGTSPGECTITDISANGARLIVSNVAVPDNFYLQISGERPVREACRVVWRLGEEVGVEFISRQVSQEREVLIKKVRSEAQKLLRG